MPINFEELSKKISPGTESTEYKCLKDVLAILKKDRTTTESDDKLLPLYLKKLNPLLLSK